MKERTKIEFVDSGASALPRPAFDDSSTLKSSIIASSHNEAHMRKDIVRAPMRERIRVTSQKTQLAKSKLAALSDDLIQTTGVMTTVLPVDIQEKTQKTPKSYSAALSVSTAPAVPAKSPCNCGCRKKSKKKKAKTSLVVDTGETKVFTTCAQFDKIDNKGTIELAEGAVLRSVELVNTGSIKSEHDLELHADLLNAEQGSIASPSKITVISKNDLIVRGGDFISPAIKFDAEGKLDVYAHRMDGKVFAKGGAVSFGVKAGDLDVVEHICTGDPVYWHENTTGTLSVGNVATFGEDLVIWSNSPNISVGNIDTTGGSGPGRVTIITNAGATRPGTPSEYPYDCSDCSSFVPSGGGGGTVQIGLNNKINAGGPVEIRGNVDALTYLWIETPKTESGSGGDNTITIKGDITSPGQGVVLSAGNKIRVDGNITTGSSSVGGFAIIEAFKRDSGTPTSSEFIIGGSGNTNGVNGNINCSTSGAGADGNNVILVRNYGAGGVTLDNMSALNVQVGNGRTGSIVLDADDGAVTLPAGSLSVDGASGQPAGRIYLTGDSIVADSGATTITASDDGSGLFHKLGLAAATFTYGSGGLTIKSNGGGGQQNDPSVGIFSKDSIQITTTTQVLTGPTLHLTVSVQINSSTAISNPIEFTGGGTLKLEANSFNEGPRQIWCYSSDLTFNGGPVEMECNGDEVLITFRNFGHLKFAGDAVNLTSDGYDDSKGGFVDVFCETFERTSTSTLEMHADGDGKGDGGTASLAVANESATPIVLGLSNGSIHASADGGSDDGNGGTVEFISGTTSGAGTPITIKDSIDPESDPVLSVAPRGDDGDGGTIRVVAKANVTFTEADNELNADGKGNGKGGSIYLTASGTDSTLDLGENILSAKGGDTGDGGYIQLIGNTDITMKAAKLTVTVGQDDESNGKGGSIKGKSEEGDIVVEGNLNTDGKGKGKGGIIFLDANQELNYGTNEFSAKGGDKGDGGYIYLKSGENFTIAGSKTHVDPGQDDESNGEGGTIQIESGKDLTITGTMNANGKGKGKGGQIVLSAKEKLTRSSTTLHVDGGCLGHGGIVSSNSDSIDATNGIITAKSGDGNCTTFKQFVNTQGTRGGDYTIFLRGVGPSFALTDNIDVSGLGEGGAGGSVKIRTPGSFSFDSHDIKADGTTGDGGIIDIECGQSLEIFSSQVSAKSGSGNSKGGTISITVMNGNLKLSGTEFDVSGKGSGKGGNLIFDCSSFILESELKANGGNLGEGGDGGMIIINTRNSLTHESIPTDKVRLHATGFENGKGGQVFIKRIRGNPDPEHLAIPLRRMINVEGGNEAEDWGSISLNKVLNKQWRWGNSSVERWPRSCWTTINTTAVGGTEAIAMEPTRFIDSNLNTVFQLNEVDVGVMSDYKQYEKFFGVVVPPIPGIPLALAGLSSKYFTSTVFQSANGQTNPGLQWSMLHELGHQGDFIFDWRNSEFNNALALDIGDRKGINRLSCNAVLLPSTCNAVASIPRSGVRNWFIFGYTYSYFIIPLHRMIAVPNPTANTPELIPDIFAAVKAKGQYRNPLERTDEGELRKAYKQFTNALHFFKTKGIV